MSKFERNLKEFKITAKEIVQLFPKCPTCRTLDCSTEHNHPVYKNYGCLEHSEIQQLTRENNDRN